MVQEILRDRRFSQAFRLYFFIFTSRPGVAITMAQMQEAIGISRDAVSNILVEIRKGRVPNPIRRGEYLPSISIHYAYETKAYYDLGKATMDNLEQQIPQSILRNRLRHVRTRTGSIQSALGDRGLLGAISEGPHRRI